MKININAQPGTSKNTKTGSWRTLEHPVVDHEKCIDCYMCDRICPEGVCFPIDEKNSKGKTVHEVDLDYCKGCGLCEYVCPVKAIKMEKEKK